MITISSFVSFGMQGMASEIQALAELPHFSVGGAIHLVVNNQLGFTTPANRGRSCIHCTDIAKLNGNLVLHVNGDYPEVKFTVGGNRFGEFKFEACLNLEHFSFQLAQSLWNSPDYFATTGELHVVTLAL